MKITNKTWITFFLFLIGTFTTKRVISQEDYAGILRATYQKGRLKVTFINCSNEVAYAPKLALRRGNNSNELYHEYWGIKVDTLELSTTTKVSRNLYSLINREGGSTNGLLYYDDELLQPEKKSTKKVIIGEIPRSVRFLRFGVYLVPLCR